MQLDELLEGELLTQEGLAKTKVVANLFDLTLGQAFQLIFSVGTGMTISSGYNADSESLHCMRKSHILELADNLRT